MKQSARYRAIQQLNRIEEHGAYIGLEDAEGQEDARAHRQTKEYVAGITRWRRRLDFILAHFYRGDYAEMELPLRQILRLGLYDLLYLNTPAHAALNEAVELAKQVVRPGAGRLTNGILRAVQRSQQNLPEPDTGDAAEDLAIAHSHPTWLVRRWLERFGPEETTELLRWNNQRPVYGLRLREGGAPRDAIAALLDEHGAAWEASRYLDDFLRTSTLQPVLRAGLFERGKVAVQDEAAGLVVRVLDPQPGETIVDGCSAPGGKALYSADRMRGRGHLYAYDIHRGRLRLVERAAKTHRTGIIHTERADLRVLARTDARPTADRVLLDVPCSGLGVLAKRADMRWHRTPENLEELLPLQDELLEAGAELVRPGGLLVYSTCTIEPEENEERVKAFLERRPDFEMERADGLIPEAVVNTEGTLSTLPHRHQIDGAFAVRLRRKHG